MNTRRPVVAIVDDDPRLLESLQDLLESAEYRIKSFSSADELLSSRLDDVDLLISDIGIPGMTGIELRDLLKKEHPELPVFLITGRHELADKMRSQNIAWLFRKPFDAKALLAAVADVLLDHENGG